MLWEITVSKLIGPKSDDDWGLGRGIIADFDIVETKLFEDEEKQKI